MSETRFTTLPSGLRIGTHAMPHLKTITIAITFGVGARDERDDEHGISHLLEHMAFKGTTRRTARQIAEEIEAVGGDLNAATSNETTTYYCRLLAEDAPLALDILADILINSTFDPAELAREQGVIVQEISAVEDSPEELVFDRFNSAAFPGQALGRTILGTVETVTSFTAEKLRAFMHRHYVAGRAVVTAAGALEHDVFVAQAARAFEAIPLAAAELRAAAHYQGGASIVTRRTEQVNLVIGLEGMGYRATDIYALSAFANILGGGMSSRLFQEVREQRGLCYSISAFHWAFDDTGLFGIYAGAAPKDIPTLVPVIREQLLRAAADVTEAELARARAQMKVGLVGALESASARAEQLARQITIFGRPIEVDAILQRISAITRQDVCRIGAVLADGPVTLSAIGAKGAMTSLQKFKADWLLST